MKQFLEHPAVMTFSGHDPSGAAGIQADIETLRSLGCYCSCVTTAITAQDTQNVKDFVAVDPVLVIEQARAVLEDIPIAAFKIGLVTDIDVIEAIHTIFMDYPNIPVVIDPIIAAGGGAELGDSEKLDAMKTLLFPHADIVTPNTGEAKQLSSNVDSLAASVSELMLSGCDHILVTGADEINQQVINRLYNHRGLLQEFSWERLVGQYHGSGCTLAAAITGYLAHGATILDAVEKAQEFTWQSLKNAVRLGQGQLHPNRFFWVK